MSDIFVQILLVIRSLNQGGGIWCIPALLCHAEVSRSEVKGIDRSWLRVEETLHSEFHQDVTIRVIFPRVQGFHVQVRKCSENTKSLYYHIWFTQQVLVSQRWSLNTLLWCFRNCSAPLREVKYVQWIPWSSFQKKPPSFFNFKSEEVDRTCRPSCDRTEEEKQRETYGSFENFLILNQ